MVIKGVKTVKENLLGNVYGFLEVVNYAENIKGRTAWLCKCICGTEKSILSKSLICGDSKSCGCKGKDKSTKLNQKKKAPEYSVWSMMKDRCLNENSSSYKHYGGRGITVCEKWKESFINFLNDMGERPSDKHSLDRINNDGNYEPSNCRWTTRFVQRINSRSGLKNTSGAIGVHWRKRQKRWQVLIGINNKRIIIGYYKTFDEAVKARKSAELLYWGKSS